MNYKVEKKKAFTVLANSKIFNNATAQKEIPQFWTEHFQSGKGKYVMGTFGICLDDQSEKNTFKYMIADSVDEKTKVLEGFELFSIPEHTYVVFSCIGPMPDALQKMTKYIYSEWMKQQTEFEVIKSFNVEYYDDSAKYKNGSADEQYQSEIWIPIQQK